MGFSDWFGGGAAAPAAPAAGVEAVAPEVKKTPSCKICCACPHTRGPRDDCIIRNGVENCKEEIEAHYTCLLSEGFSQEQVDNLRKRSQQ